MELGEIVFNVEFEIGEIIAIRRDIYVLRMWGVRKHPMLVAPKMQYGQELSHSASNISPISEIDKAHTEWLVRRVEIRG